MHQRLDFFATAPDALRAMRGVQDAVNRSGLDHALLQLVEIRASQINGCTFCLAMHTRIARKAGESEERMHLLAAWREATCYTDRERAALAWTESVTLVAQTHAPDDVYEEASRHFTPKELADLTLAITVINSWNRLMIAFRTPPQAEPAQAPIAPPIAAPIAPPIARTG
jgi:AhpD family alkylhydroperoxidase